MKRKKDETEWPFENGGYLTGKQLFDILLLKRQAELEEHLKEVEELTVQDLRKMYRTYLSESVLGLSAGERRFLTEYDKGRDRGAGILKTVIEMTDWEICLGSCCTKEGYAGTEISADGVNHVRVDFLRPGSSEETERIIRVMTIEETGKEITGSEPVAEKGRFRAVRPKAADWGMRIMGRKGRKDEKHML